LVEEVNPEKEKVKVIVTIFGRQTPIELDYYQINRIG
jgi:transcriptional antiterminator NusG